jgi:hypothetical protein
MWSPHQKGKNMVIKTLVALKLVVSNLNILLWQHGISQKVLKQCWTTMSNNDFTLFHYVEKHWLQALKLAKMYLIFIGLLWNLSKC